MAWQGRSAQIVQRDAEKQAAQALARAVAAFLDTPSTGRREVVVAALDTYQESRCL